MCLAFARLSASGMLSLVDDAQDRRAQAFGGSEKLVLSIWPPGHTNDIEPPAPSTMGTFNDFPGSAHAPLSRFLRRLARAISHCWRSGVPRIGGPKRAS